MSVKKSTTPRFNIDVSNDELYLEGYKEGVRRKTASTIENMFFEGSFSINDITEITEETKDFVLSIQNKLIQEGRILPNS